MGDNYQIAKIHLIKIVKMFFSRTTGPISTKASFGEFKFVEMKFPRGDYEIAKIH